MSNDRYCNSDPLGDALEKALAYNPSALRRLRDRLEPTTTAKRPKAITDVEVLAIADELISRIEAMQAAVVEVRGASVFEAHGYSHNGEQYATSATAIQAIDHLRDRVWLLERKGERGFWARVFNR